MRRRGLKKMSSVLVQEASLAAAITASVLDVPNGASAPGSPQQQQSLAEKDVSYWQRSLEVLSQKVIVGDSATFVVKREKKNTTTRSKVLGAEEEEMRLDSQCPDQRSSPEDDSVPVQAEAEEVVEGCDENGGCCEHNEEDGDAANDISEEEEQQQQQQQQHDSNLFRLSCCCGACFNSRETIIQLFVEDFEYNTLWERLQLLIKKFYDVIPE